MLPSEEIIEIIESLEVDDSMVEKLSDVNRKVEEMECFLEQVNADDFLDDLRFRD